MAVTAYRTLIATAPSELDVMIAELIAAQNN